MSWWQKEQKKWSGQSDQWGSDSWTNDWSHSSNQSHRPSSSFGHVDLPQSWRQTDTHHDAQEFRGHSLFRQIQATPWSRKKHLVGQDPLQVKLAQLTRHGAEEYAFRLLSEGKFVGVVTTRNIAESVLLSAVLKMIRDEHVDIDKVAEYIHKQQKPGVTPPSKIDHPNEFMHPLASIVFDEIKKHSPPAVDAQAVHKVAEMQQQISKYQRKLEDAGIQLTPTKHRQDDDDDDDDDDAQLPSSNKRRRKQPGTSSAGDHKVLPTPEQVLDVRSKMFSDNLPKSHTNLQVESWIKSFRIKGLQAHVDNVSEMLVAYNKSAKKKPNFQEVAIQYGLPMGLAAKMNTKNLTSVIGVASFLAA